MSSYKFKSYYFSSFNNYLMPEEPKIYAIRIDSMDNPFKFELFDHLALANPANQPNAIMFITYNPFHTRLIVGGMVYQEVSYVTMGDTDMIRRIGKAGEKDADGHIFMRLWRQLHSDDAAHVIDEAKHYFERVGEFDN